METTLQLNHNGQITLPSSVRTQANLKIGDFLQVIIEMDGSLRLIPQIMDEQAYFWSERWQQGEREAEADIQAGRLHRFENLDDAFAFLDEEE